MQYHALACDYDGTLAHDGVVAESVIEDLIRLKHTGRRLLLVTGRILEELLEVFPATGLFDRVVAENGALIYDPATREIEPLAAPPPLEFADALYEKTKGDVRTGRIIVATWAPHEVAVLNTIRDQGLEMQVIFNKGAVMVLPSGVNKATGLQAALNELSLSPHNTIAVGDAENDHAMFSLAECAVAVANAIPSVRQHADFVTKGAHGDGVRELVRAIISEDAQSISSKIRRHDLCIGRAESGGVTIDPNHNSVLICGPSGTGKSLMGLAIAEQLAAHDYQFVAIDPERDFSELTDAVVLGDSKRSPRVPEIMQALQDPSVNVVVSLLGLPHSDRPTFFSQLMPALREMQTLYGRPHWLLTDEAHYVLPNTTESDSVLPDGNALLLTVHPNHLAKSALDRMDVLVTTAHSAKETIRNYCSATQRTVPLIDHVVPADHHYYLWRTGTQSAPIPFEGIAPRQEHHRHLRKYAEGDLGAFHSFYFTGASHSLNLKAQNLQIFMQLADGVDDVTWQYHLRRHDYSRWMRGSVRDNSLANELTAIENDFSLSPSASREKIKRAIEMKYAAPV